MMPADREAAIRAAVDALVAALLAAATPEPAATPERLHSIGEASAILGVGRSAIYTELQAGRLRGIKVGRRRLVASGAISDYIRAGDVSAVEAPPSRSAGHHPGRAGSGSAR